MKKRITNVLIGLLAITTLFLLGCATMAKGGTEADVEAIKEIWEKYCSSAINGDVALRLSIWDEDFIQMPPNQPARSREEIEKGIEKSWASRNVLTFDIDAEEIVISVDWAYSRGTYVSDRMVEGNTVRMDGKFLTIFRRQPDGSWKIYRDCFNSNTP
jgi:ketosteroid isomerase-like protein